MRKTVGYILLVVGVLPILIAVYAVMEGIMAILLLHMFSHLGVTIFRSLIAMGFFVSLLTGVYLLKKR